MDLGRDFHTGPRAAHGNGGDLQRPRLPCLVYGLPITPGWQAVGPWCLLLCQSGTSCQVQAGCCQALSVAPSLSDFLRLCGRPGRASQHVWHSRLGCKTYPAWQLVKGYAITTNLRKPPQHGPGQERCLALPPLPRLGCHVRGLKVAQAAGGYRELRHICSEVAWEHATHDAPGWLASFPLRVLFMCCTPRSHWLHVSQGPPWKVSLGLGISTPW